MPIPDEYEDYHWRGYWSGLTVPRSTNVLDGGVCTCGHDLGVHLPDMNLPFAWPCRLCDCREYRDDPIAQSVIYILDAAETIFSMLYVRVTRGLDGRWRVYEGLTNR